MIFDEGDLPVKSTASKESVADSTRSNASPEHFEEPVRKSRQGSIFSFGNLRKTRQSLGGYTSLFARKLLPPLGFYRETDKYAALKSKFKDDPSKLDALDEMWDDYQKYQARKRFRWPPQLLFQKFFWTTGYYADYQKDHRATKLRKPGEDSSDEEFFDPAGMYIVTGGDDDINVEEFERYREAKKNAVPNPYGRRRSTRFNFDEPENEGRARSTSMARPSINYLQDRRPTVSRLFPGAGGGGKDNDSGAGKGAGRGPRKSTAGGDRRRRQSVAQDDTAREIEEVETVVEYTVIRDPNKKKRKSSAKPKQNQEEEKEIDNMDGIDIEALKLTGGKKVITSKRRSVAKINKVTGEKTEIPDDVSDTPSKRNNKRKSMRK